MIVTIPKLKQEAGAILFKKNSSDFFVKLSFLLRFYFIWGKKISVVIVHFLCSLIDVS